MTKVQKPGGTNPSAPATCKCFPYNTYQVMITPDQSPAILNALRAVAFLPAHRIFIFEQPVTTQA